MDAQLNDKVCAFVQNLKNTGSKRPADREEQATFNRPTWFDVDKFQIGSETGRDLFFSIFTAHLSELVILVYNQSILETLISTGNSQNIVSLFKRYFSTAVHVKKWYDGDIWDQNDVAFKSISQIRSIHRKVMNDRNKNLKIDEETFKFSQLDMAMTQYAFLGQIVANGHQFGLKLTDDQLSGLIHFWRCIGHLLGMEDEFNLFTKEDLNFQRSLCGYILENEIKPTVANSKSDQAKAMSFGICASVKGIVSLIYAKTFLKFSLVTNGLVRQANKIELNFYENTLFRIMNLTFGYLYKFSLARKFFNRLLNLSFYRTEQRFALKSERLSLTYPNLNIASSKNDNRKSFTAITM